MKRKQTKTSEAYDRFMALADHEKSKEASRFDREFVSTETRPLTPKERREWQAVKRGPGRPRKGRGATVISLSVERDLLTSADSFAKAQGLSRSELFVRGVRAVMVAAGAA